MKQRFLFLTVLVPALLIPALLLLSGCKRKPAEIVIIPDVQKNHLQRNHIFGQVKELCTYTLLPENSVAQNDTMALDSLRFDTVSVMVQHYSPDGYLLDYCKMTPQGDTLAVRIFAYHADARADYWKEFYPGEPDTVVCHYEYDMNDFLSAEKIFVRDSVLSTTSYKTDGEGNVIEMVRHYDGYSVRNTSKYNAQGLLSRIDEFEPSGKLFKYVTIEYDNYGDEVNRRAFKGENDLIEYTYTQYQDNGALLKVLFEDRLHNDKEQYVYEGHDQQKNWTSETRYKNKKLQYKRIRTYIYY